MRFKVIATNFIRLLLVQCFVSFSLTQMIMASYKKRQHEKTEKEIQVGWKRDHSWRDTVRK